MLKGESLDNQYNFQVLMLHEALNVDTMHAIMPISVLTNDPIFSLKCEWFKKRNRIYVQLGKKESKWLLK